MRYIKRTVDLNAMMKTEELPGSLFEGEALGHTFVIDAIKDKASQTLTGIVTAAFELDTCSATVELAGSIVSGAAVVTLTEACYVPGRFTLTIYCTADGDRTALWQGKGRINKAGSGAAYDPDALIPNINELYAEIESMRAATVAANAAADLATRYSYEVTLDDDFLEISTNIPAVRFGFVRPEAYGAKGDGTTDDTDAIQDAIDSGFPVIFGRGRTYLVSVSESGGAALTAISGTRMILNGATIQLAANAYGAYAILSVNGVSDVLIEDGLILGDRQTHTGATGEHGHGVSVGASSGVTLRRVAVDQCWGDGLYIGGDTPSQRVQVRACMFNKNSRNNISVVNAKGVWIEDCVLTNADRTNPRLGIDLETNSAADFMQGIHVSRCKFAGNTMGGISLLTHADESSVFIDGCEMDGTLYALQWGENSRAVISNCLIHTRPAEAGDDPGRYMGSVFTLGNNEQSSGILIHDCTADCANGAGTVFLFSYGSENNRMSTYNVTCKNLVLNGGTIGRTTISYYADGVSLLRNIDLEIKLKNADITEAKYPVSDEYHISNTTKFEGITTLVNDNYYIPNCFDTTIIGPEVLNGNVFILMYYVRGTRYTVYNASGASKNLMLPDGTTWKLKDEITGTESTSVTMADGDVVYYWYDLLARKIRYMM